MLNIDEINRVTAVSKEISSQWITIKSIKDKTYQTFKASELENWLNGEKMRLYKYFTFRSNNPYISFLSKNHISLSLDKVYLTDDLPYKDIVGAEYYKGINDNDVITVYYSNAWWENCLNWDSANDRDKFESMYVQITKMMQDYNNLSDDYRNYRQGAVVKERNFQKKVDEKCQELAALKSLVSRAKAKLQRSGYDEDFE